MAKPSGKKSPTTENGFQWYGALNGQSAVEGFKNDIKRHMASSLGVDYTHTHAFNFFRSLTLTVRDRVIDSWIKTQRSYYERQAKRVYYLSLEYLPGRFLLQHLLNLDLYDVARQAVTELGFDLDELLEMEWDPGLGNGGLGRLASCFMDSMATMNIPAYGYGIRYDYGIFYQSIRDGQQVESCDNWMRFGNLWEYVRPQHLYEVKALGRVHQYEDALGRVCHDWVDTQSVMAMSCDMIISGFHNNRAINMRLWAAKSSREFNFDLFNSGNYIGAVERQVQSENISKVLYPNDSVIFGQQLRLAQQYFFVSATLQDIIRRFTKRTRDFSLLPDKVAIHLNETHPAIAIPEMMRLLVDQERLGWDAAWDICTRMFAYTNHTIMPEALETWPVDLISRALPRHLEIIYEINRRFLDRVASFYTSDQDKAAGLSIIQGYPGERVRMANLAVVGSSSVNGVSALHTEILKNSVFHDFHAMMPNKFNNKTNGVSPRRWLLQCNPSLARLISDSIGSSWVTKLDDLKKLEPLAEDKDFRKAWQEVKYLNKRALAAYVRRETGLGVRVGSLFDVQVKRIHEYKRQMLNILHVITMYNRMKDLQINDVVPRTCFFAGKAAPGYFIAKMIIHLINSISSVINKDPRTSETLRVVFLANYCVSQAEKIVPAADLSEQISTAGTEASGTGNMKFALNGALTIGTRDGANLEMGQSIGEENMFFFGKSANELADLRMKGYDPRVYYESDNELKRALDMIAGNAFSPDQPGKFKPLIETLLYGDHADPYFVLADYQDYINKQAEVDQIFQNRDEWTRRSILNTARMGFFSSDRAIAEYAKDIWNVTSLE